jgi:hypothetical protein
MELLRELTMKYLMLLPCVVALSICNPARAACHFAFAEPIVCTDAITAALAYQQYGFDLDRIHDPHSQQLLHKAMCKSYPHQATMPLPIQLIQVDQLALADGYANVDLVSLDGKDPVHVAAQYLAGTCNKSITTTSSPQPTGTP